jgi:hypothetical protein
MGGVEAAAPVFEGLARSVAFAHEEIVDECASVGRICVRPLDLFERLGDEFALIEASLAPTLPAYGHRYDDDVR